MNRREFIRNGAAVSALITSAGKIFGAAPNIIKSKGSKPFVISSNNGNFFKNGGKFTAVELAFQKITEGSDVLDALIEGVNIPELDPEEMYVGFGGLPNANGIVQLDSSCMHGPKKQAGAVAALEGVRTPSKVARAVMANTDHHLLVGKGAQDFARNMGFQIEDDLNSDLSRKAWLEWKRKIDPEHFPNPDQRSDASKTAMKQLAQQGFLPSSRMHGTINCDGVNSKGDLCGVTTTSGLPFKIPGRVGDSPILGAGLYVDNDVAAVGSTGRGEANLFGLSSFLIVENLRKGMAPKDAGMDALRRIKKHTVEKRLRKEDGDPNFNVNFYILTKSGEHAAVALYADDEEERGYAGNKTTNVQYSFCDENGPRTVQVEGLLPGTPQDKKS